MRRIERAVLEEWQAADARGERLFPHEFMYRILLSGKLDSQFQIDPKDSWLMAAAEKNLPMVVPGWEDATLGNMYAGHVHQGQRQERAHGPHRHRVHDVARRLVPQRRAPTHSIGFFQIGGGIAGDFPICVVPMLHQDLGRPRHPVLGLLLPDQRFDHQLTAATPARCPTRRSPGASSTSTRPSTSIESDATIVAPLDLRLPPGLVAQRGALAAVSSPRRGSRARAAGGA